MCQAGFSAAISKVSHKIIYCYILWQYGILNYFVRPFSRTITLPSGLYNGKFFKSTTRHILNYNVRQFKKEKNLSTHLTQDKVSVLSLSIVSVLPHSKIWWQLIMFLSRQLRFVSNSSETLDFLSRLILVTLKTEVINLIFVSVHIKTQFCRCAGCGKLATVIFSNMRLCLFDFRMSRVGLCECMFDM